jgi:hypothetical protein
VCQPNFRVVESWSCVDLVSLELCGNSGCASTMDRVVVCQHSILFPFNELIFCVGI